MLGETVLTSGNLAIDKSIADMDSAFLDFQRIEADSWKMYGAAPLIQHLVKPSGSLTSCISHRLNQPSFTTHFPDNGVTADGTNPCISMVMGTAFNADTLLYDQIHRRDADSNGSMRYPPYVIQAHHEWTMKIWESSEAKIEIVYGRAAQRGIVANPTLPVNVTALPLWGAYAGLVILLIHEDNFRNAQKEYRFRRVMICAKHPQ